MLCRHSLSNSTCQQWREEHHSTTFTQHAPCSSIALLHPDRFVLAVKVLDNPAQTLQCC